MNDLDNIHIQSINTVAQCLNLTPRRIRQFVEDKNIPRLGRGLVDLGWATYFHIGCLQVEDLANKPKDPKTLVALAWLSGLDKDPSAKDIDGFVELFTRNCFTRDDALRAIGKAEWILENV